MGDNDTTGTEPTADPAGKASPKWETATRDRLRKAIGRFAKPLQELVARDANEGDTRLFITDMLCDGLGFDKYEDLTTEYLVRGEFADYGLRIDKQLVAFVEVKRCTTKLGEKHLRQVQTYAMNEGVEWVILTNGAVWQAYHLTAALPMQIDLAFEIDLLGEDSPAKKAELFFYLTKESLRRRQIDTYWRAQRSMSPQALAQVVLSDPVVDEVRKELWRRTQQRLTSAEVRDLLTGGVLRSEVV